MSLLSVVVFTWPTQADIFQWEYVNPADPSQGKRQSTTLAPDGAGVDAVPDADLSYRNLSMAYLIGADLTGAYGYYASLYDADLSQANLTNAYFRVATLTDADFSETNLSNVDFSYATLTSADFTDAEIRGANFVKTVPPDPYCCGPPAPVGTGITPAQLYSTASYQAGNLSGINFGLNDLMGGNFAGQDLTAAKFFSATLTSADFRESNLIQAYLGYATASNADFRDANLSGASFFRAILIGADFLEANLAGANFGGANLMDVDFTGAEVRGASLSKFCGFLCFGTGINLAQLVSTTSYQNHDLTGIDLGGSDLTGGSFAGHNLANASFLSATLTGADFTSADTRGAQFLDLIGASSTNLIRTDGHISGVDLSAASLLVVRDYDGDSRRNLEPIPITVDEHLTIGPGGTLRMVFEANAWDSTISFAPGIPVTLGGTLELAFAADVNPASQVGRTFDLFDWTGDNPVGAFAISSQYTWDLSNLYTTGEVTLIAVPEPATVFLAVIGMSRFYGARICRRKSAHPKKGIYVPSSDIRPGIYARCVDGNLSHFSGGGVRRRRTPPPMRWLIRAPKPGMNAGPNTVCGGNDRKRSWSPRHTPLLYEIASANISGELT